MTEQTDTTAPEGPQTELTADDFFMSLTGFDEIAIAKAFGADISALRDSPFRFMRALVFVDQRRKGSKDPEAFQAAMSPSISQTNDYFPDAAASDEGKGSPSA